MRPVFSIVIPVYNGSRYLEGCVQSILAQSFTDFELVIVDDKSQDDSFSVAQKLASCDDRIRAVQLNENSGTLIARKTGVLSTTGEYVLLVDQDDELSPQALLELSNVISGNPYDIVHFGVNVVSENEDAQEAQAGMLEYVTPLKRVLHGSEILEKQFSEVDGFDWNVHHKAYRGDLAREAWSKAHDERLTLSDDLYASFIIAFLAESYIGLPEHEWYVYHLGRGETFGSKVSLIDCIRTCDRDVLAFSLTKSFASENGLSSEREGDNSYLQNVAERLVEHSVNELSDKLPAEDWSEALQHYANVWERDILTAELLRLIRDRSYRLVSTGDKAADDEQLSSLLDAVATSGCPCGSDTRRGAAFRQEAILHLHEIGIVRPDISQHINIFVTTHKDVFVPPISSFTPVQVGSRKQVFSWAAQDNAGDNISTLNPYYCELTTQYWAWKNVDADYYGFCHYRRYFNFSNEHFEENPFGEIIHPIFDAPASWHFGMTDEEIANKVDGADVITTQLTDLPHMPGDYETPLEHYAAASHLRIVDLNRVFEIVEKLHPDYAADVESYTSGHHSCFCNMFIMKRDLFSRYCSWLFPILEQFMASWDRRHLSHEALRTPGHLAERLLNVFLIHEQRANPSLNWKTLQCVHFEHPERLYVASLPSMQQDAGRPVIPVVFAADNNYVPMVTTAIASMLANASTSYRYDIVVLERDISQANQRLMTEFVSTFDNSSIRFADVTGMVRSKHLQTNNPHISIETYYRFLIENVLPDYNKVIYLDSDLIVRGDISELFNVDLGSNLVAATRDIDYAGNLNMPDGERYAYSRDVLQLEKPFDYFQAGVLVFNLVEMRRLHSLDEWLELAANSHYIYDDQDILNAQCQGRVFYLDQAWNVMTNCDRRIERVFSFAPAEMFDSYMAAYRNPKLVHYAGYEKPWNCVTCDKAVYYWRYARETPFYEQLLFNMCADRRSVDADIEQAKGEVIDILTRHERAIGEKNPIRGTVDVVLPLGSRRREIVKAVARKMRGRK